VHKSLAGGYVIFPLALNLLSGIIALKIGKMGILVNQRCGLFRHFCRFNASFRTGLLHRHCLRGGAVVVFGRSDSEKTLRSGEQSYGKPDRKTCWNWLTDFPVLLQFRTKWIRIGGGLLIKDDGDTKQGTDG
jgi:hypothetical protein